MWLDGQEITQFTYFQQAGGQPLDPVSVEITYGLDRIALALQGLESVWSMEYGIGIPYGDVLLASEMSTVGTILRSPMLRLESRVRHL